jgi:NTF2 fold immunity protein
VPKDGFVPDSETEVKIAEALLVPVYGKEKIESERPFKATLQNNVWTVTGSLYCPDGKDATTKACDGGTAEVKLSKADGRVLKMIHSK